MDFLYHLGGGFMSEPQTEPWLTRIFGIKPFVEPTARDQSLAPRRPVPPAATRAELEFAEDLQIARAALKGIAKLTEDIVKLSPSDIDTYRLMLDVRDTFVEIEKRRMQRRVW